MSYAYRVITHEKPNSFESEQYKKLRTNIEYLSIKKEYKTICITSSMANEGKTYTVINLASVYAQNRTKTLVIDLDLRRPKIHYAFNLSNDIGITDLAKKNFKVDNIIQPVNKYLDAISAGSKFPYPSELLSSQQMRDLIEELQTRYDKIIIDTPPVILFSDSKIVANFCDGTLFVLASKKSKIECAKNAIKELTLSDVDIMGSVLTRVPTKQLTYGKEYYYKGYTKS